MPDYSPPVDTDGLHRSLALEADYQAKLESATHEEHCDCQYCTEEQRYQAMLEAQAGYQPYPTQEELDAHYESEWKHANEP